MDTLPIVLIVIAGVALITVLIIYFRRKANVNGNDVSSTVALDALEQVQGSEIAIPIVQIPITTVINEKSLYEISDRTIVARISQTIPAIAETATRTIANNTLKNTALYKAVIPSGTMLTKSRQMEGAVRGYFHGAKGVKGQANLIKVDPTQISKTTAVANGVANVMNVGSLVVGQYYMSEINSKLEMMSNILDKVSDFQDREFKSRILSLISRVGEISQFSSEIMENDELRNIKLTSLENLKGIATELLGQVNITITDISQKNPNPNYQEYQKNVDDFGALVGYQNVLITVLEEISKLTYLLGKGGISSEMSYSLFNKFLEQSVQILSKLEQWHDRQVKVLRINLDENRISKSGFEGIISAIPGFLNDNWKYKELKQGLVEKISAQVKAEPKIKVQPRELYCDDVEIIIRDGKYYYLHEAKSM